MTFSLGSCRIAVVGLGYVGLPLACEFAKKYPVVGFDIDERRIAELILNQDRTNEVSVMTLLRLKDYNLAMMQRVYLNVMCSS